MKTIQEERGLLIPKLKEEKQKNSIAMPTYSKLIVYNEVYEVDNLTYPRIKGY